MKNSKAGYDHRSVHFQHLFSKKKNPPFSNSFSRDGPARYQKDRQRTYNVTLRRVRIAIVTVDKQEVLHNLSVYL